MDDKVQENIVKAIVQSKSFHNKEVLKGLLMFLYKSYKKRIQIKEIDIAIDYFKRKDAFLPGEDTIVRVNIHKLRQLLEKYYVQEGKDDPVRIELPKGSYGICFINKNELIKTENSSIWPRINLILLVILILSLILNIVMFINPINSQPVSQHVIWNDFINSYRPVCVILGDPFFYSLEDSGETRTAFRKFTINSVDDLKAENMDRAYKLDYPYFSNNNVLPLPDILPLIDKNGNKLQLQALSEVNVENIKNCIQVFIANINSFGMYNQFLEKSSIHSFHKL
jgi:hypothetical protein